MTRLSPFLLFLSVCLCCMAGCTVGPPVQDGTVIKTNQNQQGSAITLRFTRGPDFGLKKHIGFMTLTLTPQIAIWVEDTAGNYLQTLYVTHKFAKQEWGPVPHDKNKCFRTSSLPYWLNKYIHAGNTAPATNTPLPDAVTAATPAGCFDLVTTVTASQTPVVVLVEINSSFDHNAAFGTNRKASKINGQPAVVYSAKVDVHSGLFPVVSLALFGHSGETGNDPRLYKDVSGLTTAKRMFDCINVILPQPTPRAGADTSDATTGATMKMPSKEPRP